MSSSGCAMRSSGGDWRLGRILCYFQYFIWVYTAKSNIKWTVLNHSPNCVKGWVSGWKEVNISWKLWVKHQAKQWLVILMNTFKHFYWYTLLTVGSGRGNNLGRLKCPGSGNEICTEVVMIPRTIFSLFNRFLIACGVYVCHNPQNKLI